MEVPAVGSVWTRSDGLGRVTLAGLPDASYTINLADGGAALEVVGGQSLVARDSTRPIAAGWP